MNSIFIIGNLTRDPELRTTPNGNTVCNFTVAVNQEGNRSENTRAQYMQVTAWSKLGELCARYLSKGKKAAIRGEATVRSFTKRDGTFDACIAVNADKVEFLTARGEDGENPMPSAAGDALPVDEGGYIRVLPDDELPW